MKITSLIKQLRDERQKAAAQVERLTQAIEALNGGHRTKPNGKFSAATRAKMARAQRARRRRERKAQ